jgi:hypothetical protein|tara:strand:+ start:3745 stop:3921 length:177 start_codon:yes stop_codon:yes gene_type:complete
MKNKQENKKFWLYLTEDEVETVIIALQESKLPITRDNGWNEESRKVEEKIQQAKFRQR